MREFFLGWQRFAMAFEQNKKGEKTDLLAHWGIVVIGTLIGITLTIFIFFGLRQNAWDLFQSIFLQHATARAQSISQELERQLDRVDGVRRFMDSKESVERETFSQYVRPLLKGASVRALEWVPRVRSEERVFYESSARQDDLERFQIYEKSDQGKNIPVLNREEYFPVYYLEPLKNNEVALGFDLASEPVRRAAMEKSRDTGQPVSTPPLVLVQEGQKKTEILIFMPVYAKDLPKYTVVQRHKNLKGFVLAVYNADEFFKDVYSKLSPDGLACLIEDLAAFKDRRVLYRHEIRDGTVDWSHPLLKYETSLEIPDRQWHAIVVPDRAFIEKNLSKAYWWTLPFGILLTALVVAFLNFLVTARYRAERLVKLRTEELNKEKELLFDREENLHLILDSTAEAIYGIDINGNCTFSNPSCLRMLGYTSAQDVLGKNMHAQIHHSYPDGKPFPVEKCQLCSTFKNNLKIHVEEVFWRSDGTSFLAEAWSYPESRNGKLVGAVISFLDITERKKTEEALRESEERYRKITSSITDYIYHVQIENGKPVSTTYGIGCLRVTGYLPEDFLLNPSLWIEIVVQEDRHIVERQEKDIFLGNKAEPIEHRIYHKEGHICWVSNTVVLQYDANGKLAGYDGLIADISERKEAEAILKQAKETAEQALAMKDEFTSTVSHELRTPLAAIKSSVDILDTEIPGKLTNDQKVFIKRVKSNIDRLARLINDVLDLSKMESGKMVLNLLPLHPEAIVQEVVETQGLVVKAKGLKIETEFEENLPTLMADKDRLIQVLNNLINNALKFTKEGGIVVSVHSEDKQNMTFCVRDTGIGIKDEDVSTLFQKFQQVGGSSQHVGGTGLGLAISKQIIAKHNGRMWVESQFGRGSAFYFIIPIRKEKRILIVDDDEATLEVLRNILEAEDSYEVEMASDGFLAGQKYYDFTPHLIILDVKIPKINGLEVCKRIKSDSKNNNIKIMMLSSFYTDMQRKEAWDAGADEILNKPINSEELIAKVRKLI